MYPFIFILEVQQYKIKFEKKTTTKKQYRNIPFLPHTFSCEKTEKFEMPIYVYWREYGILCKYFCAFSFSLELKTREDFFFFKM